MSQPQTAGPIGRPEVDQLPDGQLANLSERAHRAYERRETKEVLDLTRTMLLIDPQNTDALRMRVSVQSDLQRDLESTRALFRQSVLKEASPEHLQERMPSPLPVPEIETPELASEPSDFGISPVPDVHRRQRIRLLVGAAVFVLLGIVAVAFPILRIRWSSLNASTRGSASDSNGILRAATDASLVSSQSTRDVASILMPAGAPVPMAAPIVISPPAAPKTQDVQPTAPAPIEGSDGTLAVSSSTSVDIYRNDVFLGSVPISLNLPAGTQTLEFRHGILRKTMTYTVNGNETTKAMISFDVTVQINSKPWADVYVDGAQRRSLGQTPLGSVQVPIGAVLAFENPKFQTRKYRVTGNETGIQNVFQ